MIKNSEFFFEGNRAGILLIHGLTGTPNEMRLVGKGLNNAGFTVYGMQLAGHCGDEQDLLQTNWQDWYQSVEEAAAKLRKSVDHLFVAGLSMGAVLALKYAAKNPKAVAGVGVYGPTFKYDGWSIPAYARHLNFMLEWLQPFKLGQQRVFVEQPPYGLKDERIRAVVSRSMLSGDSAAAGLAGNPWPSLAQMNKLARKTKKLLSDVIAPCLIMHSSDDDIAHIRNSKLVERKVKGDTKLVLLEDSYHIITVDRERGKVVDETTSYFQSILANQPVVAAKPTRSKAHGSLQPLEPLNKVATS